MIEYHEITLSDKEWMDKAFWEEQKKSCEFCFANNFLWKKIYPIEVAERHGCLIMRYVQKGQIRYAYPCGAGDKHRALEEIRDEAHSMGHKLIITGIDDGDWKELLQWYPEEFQYQCDRDYFDYIYLRDNLVKLAGKKYHGKRNHIARFKDNPWSYERIQKDNRDECVTMLQQWKQKQAHRWDEDMEAEYRVVSDALRWYHELGLIGGLVRQEERVVAFCLGEPLTEDTFVVHFEKAFPDVQGAYPIINQQFAERECNGYLYINREEDDGEEGLRRAKLSYHPAMLQEKCMATEK